MDFGHISLEPVPWIRSGLRLVHFAGIILGIGAATLLDLIVYRFTLIKQIDRNSISIIVFSSSVITVGLVLLWLSGLGFLVYYWLFDIAKIENPKLIAKIIIVGILTANAFTIHYFVVPQIKTQIGRRLLDGLSSWRCFWLVLSGTVSAISWYVPLILGIVPQFNNTIPFEIILAAYVVLMLSMNVIVQLALLVMYGR